MGSPLSPALCSLSNFLKGLKGLKSFEEETEGAYESLEGKVEGKLERA